MNYQQNRLSLTKQQLKNVQISNTFEGQQFIQTEQKLQSPHIFEKQQQVMSSGGIKQAYNDIDG